jgi:negative regulator of flagellin synthesis FlgM
MRIDLYNSTASQIASEQSAQQVNGKNAASSGQVNGEDRATLTSDTTSIGSLVSTAMNSPEIRQGLVDSLKQQVSSGQYELDPGQIAASIIDDHA